MASTSPETAASNEASSSTARCWKDDVFLSYKSGDIPNGFILQLYDMLQQRKITTFVDHYSDFQVGDAISPSLRKAIEESKVAVVVLSQNYASSAWCLEELTKLCQFRENGFTILPVFYKVKAGNVRKQKGSFQDAFAKHERSGRYQPQEVQQWRDALTKVGYLSGLKKNYYRTDNDLVQAIMESICSQMKTIEIISKSDEDPIVESESDEDSIVEQCTKDFEAVEATSESTNGNSELAPQWKHDVFVSFRGNDTRKGFLSHLYHELQNTKVIRVFKDDEQLKKGKDISQSLVTAIEESRFAIIVLSENYAYSAWCLGEITKIFQCMEGKDTILPIFYHVDPSDVRYQKKSYQAAFKMHSRITRYDIKKVKQWRADLTKVGNLSGWDTKNYRSERERRRCESCSERSTSNTKGRF